MSKEATLVLNREQITKVLAAGAKFTGAYLYSSKPVVYWQVTPSVKVAKHCETHTPRQLLDLLLTP